MLLIRIFLFNADFQIDQRVDANDSVQKLENNYKQEQTVFDNEYNNGIYANAIKSSNKVTKSNKKRAGELSTARGRPRKALVPMYHSQISGDKNAIKIRIKKSNLIAPNKRKSGKRKKQKTASDTDVSDYEGSKRRTKNSVEVTVNRNLYDHNEPAEQSRWGDSVPENVLYKIFQYTSQDGSLPILVR